MTRLTQSVHRRKFLYHLSRIDRRQIALRSERQVKDRTFGRKYYGAYNAFFDLAGSQNEFNAVADGEF
jgi:hypothetical protein